MKLRAVLCATLSCLAGCAKDDVAKSPPATEPTPSPPESPKDVVATIASARVGNDLEVTVTTEPNAEVYFNPKRGGSSQVTVTSSAQGKATSRLWGYPGEIDLEVTVTAADKRRTDHVFKVTLPEPEALTVENPTPGGKSHLVGCRGYLMDADRRETVDLCKLPVAVDADGTIHFVITSPSAKKLEIDGVPFAAKDGKIEASVEVAPKVAALDLMAAMREYPVVLPVTLELTHGSRMGELELDRSVVVSLLEKAASGPVVFEGQQPRGRKAASLVMTGLVSEYFGESDILLRDLDLVAISTIGGREASPCEYVAIDGSGKTKSVARSTRDLGATVYDRRTGKKVASKTWKGKTPPCAEWVKMDEKDSYGLPDNSVLTDWANTFVR